MLIIKIRFNSVNKMLCIFLRVSLGLCSFGFGGVCAAIQVMRQPLLSRLKTMADSARLRHHLGIHRYWLSFGNPNDLVTKIKTLKFRS